MGSVTQTSDTASMLTFTFTDNVHEGQVRTVGGPLNHLGGLYKLNGQFSCVSPAEIIPPTTPPR